MTYQKIYKQLEKSGLIEKIMVDTNYDKIGIIKGIQYLEYFLNSSTFEQMQYWTESTADKTVRIVCTEYAKLQITNNNKHIAKYQYMAKTMTI
jgi:hypothetical protein